MYCWGLGRALWVLYIIIYLFSFITFLLVQLMLINGRIMSVISIKVWVAVVVGTVTAAVTCCAWNACSPLIFRPRVIQFSFGVMTEAVGIGIGTRERERERFSSSSSSSSFSLSPSSVSIYMQAHARLARPNSLGVLESREWEWEWVFHLLIHEIFISRYNIRRNGCCRNLWHRLSWRRRITNLYHRQIFILD